jgi:N-formylglutamate amidohydrolase
MANMDAGRAETLPFTRNGPSVPASPVVLSVPHAGRDYSERLLRASRLSKRQLETLEDRFVDRLIEGALRTGATAIVASRPRAEIDLNRDEREIDPAIVVPPPPLESLMPSARTRGGLGLVPARISGAGPIWRHRIECAEVIRRIEQIHRPYHAALADALDRARARFGIAILLDCHSMPPRPGPGTGQAEVVFGDLHGTTVAPDLLDVALQTTRQSGFRTACNVPYAGGYITARHGRPTEGIHAIQIEIDRSLYLSPDMRSPGKGFDRTSALFANIACAIADRATGSSQAIAAE